MCRAELQELACDLCLEGMNTPQLPTQLGFIMLSKIPSSLLLIVSSQQLEKEKTFKKLNLQLWKPRFKGVTLLIQGHTTPCS